MCQSNAAMCSADFYSLCWVSSVDRKHDRWKTLGGGGGGEYRKGRDARRKF